MPTPALQRVGLLVNPVSGRGRARAYGEAVRERLTGAGHRVLDVSGRDGAQAQARASAAVAAGDLDVLAVVGGDGTAHLGANVCAQTGIPLAIVAAGTGNDNARGLGLPRAEPTRMADLVTAGRLRDIDAGRARTDRGDRWFLGVLGGGFDTVVSDRAARMRWVHGTPRYVAAVLRELPTFRGIRYAVQVDDQRIETTAMLVAVANGRSFGAGMLVCPDAQVDDGLFDVMVLHRISVAEFLRVFPTVFSGRHVHHPAVEIRRGTRVVLEASGVRAQADGEPFESLPLTLEVVPGALRVVVP
ncbi:MAG: YegS/Rv2252/BmrU family lipid kinase [Dermatophilaceae bacterium]